MQAALTFSAEAVGSQATGFAALLLAFWAVGAQDHARHAIAGVALGCASLAVIVQWDVRFDTGNLLQGAVMGGAISLAAFVLRRRSRRAAELERQTVGSSASAISASARRSPPSGAGSRVTCTT